MINYFSGPFIESEEEVIKLHSAVYVDKNKIYHATLAEGKTCVWSIDKFNKFYKPIIARRIII